MIDPEARGTERAFFSPELRGKIIEFLPAVALSRMCSVTTVYDVQDPNGFLTVELCDDDEYTEEPLGCLKFRYVERYSETSPIVELLVGELASDVSLSDSVLSNREPIAMAIPPRRDRAMQVNCTVDRVTGEIFDYEKYYGNMNENGSVTQDSETESSNASSLEQHLVQSVTGRQAMQEYDEYLAGLRNFDEATVSEMLAVFDRVV